VNIIIMGCGRMGVQASRVLSEAGHAVTVIDNDPVALGNLGPDFKGTTVKGVGFDRNVLIQAGIITADAFAAVSSSDNANIIAARIARNIFRVPRVVARLYDPRRAEIYQRLGLVTISMIHWGAERIVELLTHSNLDPILSLGRGEVILTSIEIPLHLERRKVRDLAIPGEVDVVAITRNGEAFLATMGMEFQPGDIVNLAVNAASINRLEELLGI
jgi:trk system potassium uptake protein TrkA